MVDEVSTGRIPVTQLSSKVRGPVMRVNGSADHFTQKLAIGLEPITLRRIESN